MALLDLHISFPGPVGEAQALAAPPLSGPQVRAPAEVRSPGNAGGFLLSQDDPVPPGRRNPLAP